MIFLENKSLNSEEFRDKLMDPKMGLCVYIFRVSLSVSSKAFIVLQSQDIDLECILKKIQEQFDSESYIQPVHRYTRESMQSILNTMDSEHDKTVLKGILSSLLKREELYKLGIKPDRAVRYVSKI